MVCLSFCHDEHCTSREANSHGQLCYRNWRRGARCEIWLQPQGCNVQSVESHDEDDGFQRISMSLLFFHTIGSSGLPGNARSNDGLAVIPIKGI